MITGIHHHKICVADMERSLIFYRDLLGFEVIYDALRENIPEYDRIMALEGVRVRVVMLRDRSGGSMIGVFQFHQPVAPSREPAAYFPGFSTLAFEVDDIDRDYQRLTQAGVKSLSPVVELVRGGRPVAKAVYVLDPDGLRVELYQPLVPIEAAK